MKLNNQIYYWAHMLDESRHSSYYDVYMQQHPEDEKHKLIDSLINEFSKCIEKKHIDMDHFLDNGNWFDINGEIAYFQKKVAYQYGWHKIKASVYASIISRFTALLDRSKGQKFSESYEIGYDDVAHFVSKKVVCECLDIMCHNTNVLLANNILLNYTDRYADVLKKYGFPSKTVFSKWKGKDVEDFFPTIELYKAWAAYAKGNLGETYVCDSDNAPSQLIKTLSNCDYSADVVDLIVTLNKSLDIVHARSDLAQAFIEGGQQTCALVSNLPSKFVV